MLFLYNRLLTLVGLSFFLENSLLLQQGFFIKKLALEKIVNYALFKIRRTSLGLTFPLALIPTLYIVYSSSSTIHNYQIFNLIIFRYFSQGLYSISFLLRELIYYYIILIVVVKSILNIANSLRYCLPIDISFMLYFF